MRHVVRRKILLPITVGAIAVVGLAQPGLGQDDRMARPEAIIYRDAGYNGPAVNVTQPQPNMGLAWRVNSIRVVNGRWELCERTNFRGTCRSYDADNAMLGNILRGVTVQSMRPLGGSGGGGPEAPGNNPSLRGMAAEFYPAPAQNGRRVLACGQGSATANCAADTADRFCASLGWTASARESMETVNRRVYLADVLCSRTGY
jgi:hypothetical protein